MPNVLFKKMEVQHHLCLYQIILGLHDIVNCESILVSMGYFFKFKMSLKSGFLVFCYVVPPFGMASRLYLMANGQSQAGCSSIGQEAFVRPFLEPSPQTFFSS